MMIKEILGNSNSPDHPKLNDRQKEFIRGCTGSQLLDHQFLNEKLSTLSIGSRNIPSTENVENGSNERANYRIDTKIINQGWHQRETEWQ